jgi:urease accessory protein UreH
MTVSAPAARDDRAAHDVGRRARLELVFAERTGRTVLAHAYAEPPTRIGRCLQTDHCAHLIVASSAPGLFGGDAVEQTIRVCPGARVRLTSQSAMQIHPSASGQPASLVSRYGVSAGGELCCAWDPVIPFAGSSIVQRIEIEIDPGGRLWWSDAMMCGREGSGERWQFQRLDHQLRVRRGDALSFLERYVIEPAGSPVSTPWIAGDAAYVGTIIRAGHGDTAADAEAVHRALAGIPDVRGSADVLDDDLLLVRILAPTGVPFHRARQAAARKLELRS